MEAQNFGYSTKNIPLATPKQYQVRLTEKIESFIIRIRWKACFFERDRHEKENFGFKSGATPPPNEFLQPFEDELYAMISNLEFKGIKCSFQDKLKRDIREIRASDRVLVSADKTTNFYSVSKDEYKKLRTENITEKYKKADKSTVREINLEAKNIAKSLNIQDRVQCMAQKHAFITLKDHKDNFASHPTCRLINPAKSEIGIISKKILERVILEVKSAENLRQWRNTADVIGWFRGIRKRRATFMKFDIKEFYPNISEDLLKKSLNYAKQFTELSVQEEHIILHACKSLLFDDNAAWVKQKGGLFDIGMGSYHGAEVCELVGLFLLSKITTLFGVNKVGLYRDDGLAVLNGISDQGTDNMRKDLEKIFTDEGLGISVDTNLRITDFLDITLNLDTGKYYPYRKPNNLPLYVHKKSNHPQVSSSSCL